MLPPRTADLLGDAGHDATIPTQLGADNLPDDVLVKLAASGDRVIVTENASDFAATTACLVLLVPQGLVAGCVAGRDAGGRGGPMGEVERGAGTLGTLASR